MAFMDTGKDRPAATIATANAIAGTVRNLSMGETPLSSVRFIS
jgi:hypothetical protein